MAKPKVYIDGQEGTTGLQIYDRLGERDDIQLLLIDPARRKDTAERKKFLNEADLVFLCLPDAAAVEAVSLIENDHTRVIDCSTAHRVAEGWTYGFPELRGQREKIITARRVANPGCHATGFLACVAPLVQDGIIPADYPLTCWSLTGYSGGGKKLIAEYESPGRDPRLDSPAPYALGLSHKHLPEMQKIAGLDRPPAFLPVLGDIYKGMCTTVLLHNSLLGREIAMEEIYEELAMDYRGKPLVEVDFSETAAPGRLYTSQLAGSDRLRITVAGSWEHTLISAQFDNLGKGASGAAVQNMNLMLGFEETKGLNL
jgi:N-acetyl-gamma-glutamyl-phosphate reductase